MYEAIFRIKEKKSFGNDKISGYFLKIAFPYISRILMLIFNTSIEQVLFLLAGRLLELPQVTKKVKSQKGQNIEQYRCYLFYLGFSRNLSIISCPQYLERGGSLTSDQSGFRALHSSANCLLKCTDDWYNGMDEGFLTDLISIDLK